MAHNPIHRVTSNDGGRIWIMDTSDFPNTADGVLTLDVNNNIDTGVHPSAHQIALSTGSVTGSATPNITTLKTNEEGDLDSIEDFVAQIVANLLTILDPDGYAQLIPGVAVDDDGTYIHLNGPTTSIPDTKGVVVITEQADGKVFVMKLYKAVAEGGFTADVGRGSQGQSSVTFKAKKVATRAKGDQLFHFYRVK